MPDLLVVKHPSENNTCALFVESQVCDDAQMRNTNCPLGHGGPRPDGDATGFPNNFSHIIDGEEKIYDHLLSTERNTTTMKITPRANTPLESVRDRECAAPRSLRTFLRT